jgi:hypothetical protein
MARKPNKDFHLLVGSSCRTVHGDPKLDPLACKNRPYFLH